jgi:hypothetical protein
MGQATLKQSTCVRPRHGFVVLLLALLAAGGCATLPPEQPEDICEIFREKSDWYDAAQDSTDRWGTPVFVKMAMMYQESSFKADAQPPMQYFLGFIPTGRASTAYGYAQAKDETWEDYQRETGSSWADRDNFADAIDFMGWYTSKTQKVNGVSKWDAYNQYLNYHEGWGGFRQGTYQQKAWLLPVAGKVDQRARRYALQLHSCREELDDSWF